MLDPRNLFNIFRCDRTDRAGGGVCAMIPKKFRSHEHRLSPDDQSILMKSGCELVCIDTQLDQSKYRIILIYRPPLPFYNLNDVNEKAFHLKGLVTKLVHPFYNTIALGDFNLPKSDWIEHDFPLDGIHDVMYNCFSSLGSTQFVNEPTRISNSGNNNILDLILSNNPMCICINNIDAPFSNSDHSMICFSICSITSTVNDMPESIDITEADRSTVHLTCYNWSAANYEAINETIREVDWHSLFGYNFDADSLWTWFKQIIWPIISSYVPTKLIPHNKKYRPRAYPANIRKLLTRETVIWRQLKKSKSPELYSKYTQIANECKLEIYKYDASSEELLLDNNNLGAFYKFTNNKIGQRSSIPPLKNGNKIITTNDEKATILNKYFESIFTSDDGSQPYFPIRSKTESDEICDVRISPQIVAKVLRKLKTNSSAGPDCLSPIFFHHTCQTIAFPLSILFRSLIDTHSLPSEWKTSFIIPKFKKGSPSDPTNYRPIALTCTCCKILESLIYNDVMQYLLEHNLITEHQHGFLRRHSTTTNLLGSINDWTISLSYNNSVTIAYIDFKSAFDCISYPKLLLKLSSYGIKGGLFSWIASFLSNRSQSVKLNSAISEPCLVTSGVPQGSVLGPLLFNLFINDLTDSNDPSNTAKPFADDLKLYSSFSNISPLNLQTQLNIIQQWSNTWQLRISYTKCHILTLG